MQNFPEELDCFWKSRLCFLKFWSKFILNLQNFCFLADIYLFKVNNGNIRRMCEICLLRVVLVSLTLTLNRFRTLFRHFRCWIFIGQFRLVCSSNNSVNALCRLVWWENSVLKVALKSKKQNFDFLKKKHRFVNKTLDTPINEEIDLQLLQRAQKRRWNIWIYEYIIQMKMNI